MTNKIILITGATSGIGFQTAKDLAAKGAAVYIVGRNKERAEEAVKEIIAHTGNKNAGYFLANFSSQKSIRALAEDVKQKLPRIDVLINNAGAVFPDFQLSEDGLEMTIATNHFAYFLLTNLLLDLIKKSEAGRIVNVSSGSHYQGKLDFESFTKNKGYFTMFAYAQSKLANVFFTQELAERLAGTNITVNCLHPGMVKTNIGNKEMPWFSSHMWTLITKLAGITLKDGAKTSVYLASSDDVKNVTGKYFDKCKIKKPAKITLDKTLQKKLWEVSELYCPLQQTCLNG
ncbi:MAG: SDR family oxidoreductase [Chitinophagales bacterium]|nr:SDR family oxidoreductase [Chitinophagales bacterium]